MRSRLSSSSNHSLESMLIENGAEADVGVVRKDCRKTNKNEKTDI